MVVRLSGCNFPKTASVTVTQTCAFNKMHSPLSMSVSTQLRVLDRQLASDANHGYLIVTLDSLCDVSHLVQLHIAGRQHNAGE